MRRLPVYILVDTSWEMFGEPMRAMQEGLKEMIKSLKQNPQAIETVVLSINNLSGNSKKLNKLIALEKFEIEDLHSSECCCLGKSLDLLCDSFESEVVKITNDNKGDWIPIVLFVLASHSRDDFKMQLNRYKKMEQSTLIIKIGEKVNVDSLKIITENILDFNSKYPSDLASIFFTWHTAKAIYKNDIIQNKNLIDLRKNN